MLKVCTKCGREKDSVQEFYVANNVCKECYKTRVAAWAKAHPEARKVITDRWTKNHPGANNESSARLRRADPDKERAKIARWKKANPEKVRAEDAKRRAFKLAYEGPNYKAADTMLLFEAQGGLCAYCDAMLDTYHVDHVIPLSRGGGNGADNIALACPPCNYSKGKKLLGIEWQPVKEKEKCLSQ